MARPTEGFLALSAGLSGDVDVEASPITGAPFVSMLAGTVAGPALHLTALKGSGRGLWIFQRFRLDISEHDAHTSVGERAADG
jgi:hypothetical protein